MPGPPPVADRRWVADHLTEGEAAIWAAMSHPDQRHSVEVARAVEAEVRRRDATTGDGGRDWAALDGWFDSVSDRRRVMVRAALLHDSGKNASGLGTFARVGATLLRPLVSPARRRRWREGTGVSNRLSRYWRHPQIGSQAIAQTGSHRLVALWAAEHHLAPERWSLPVELGEILRDCDDD
jgi:hypothetical protein